jgi:protein-L-isoaspartate(D-aspartate) O-methyltransferase
MESGDRSGDQLTQDSFEARREALVRSLRLDISDHRVLEAFRHVEREQFVPRELRSYAYEDRPIPIGFGQTTSQPRMIALMLQELSLKGPERVLEVGAGSGFQTALLARLSSRVVSVELIPELAAGARRALDAMGVGNAEVFEAGDELGWPELAPYDGIIVAAAAPRIPQSLVDQLAEGGRLVIPVGSRDGQDLLIAERRPEGVQVTRKGGCRFVPLIGREAYSPESRQS